MPVLQWLLSAVAWVDLLKNDPHWGIPSSIAITIVAILVYRHHEQITHRNKRYQIFLMALRSIASEATGLEISAGGADEAKRFIEERALKTLTTSLTGSAHEEPAPGERPRLVAVILEKRHDGKFFPKYQSPNIYQFPYDGLQYNSAAGKAIELRKNSPQLEIPRKYKFDLESDAFVPLDLGNKTFRPTSSIFFALPRSADHVICVDSERANNFRTSDFEAVALIGHLIGTVLAELNRLSSTNQLDGKAPGESRTLGA